MVRLQEYMLVRTIKDKYMGASILLQAGLREVYNVHAELKHKLRLQTLYDGLFYGED